MSLGLHREKSRPLFATKAPRRRPGRLRYECRLMGMVPFGARYFPLSALRLELVKPGGLNGAQ